MESLSVRFHTTISLWNISSTTLTLCDSTRKNVDDCWPKKTYKVALFPLPPCIRSVECTEFFDVVIFFDSSGLLSWPF